MGVLVLYSIPFLFKDFQTTYWRISSLERLKSFQILQALWGSIHQSRVVTVSQGISFFHFFKMNTTRVQRNLVSNNNKQTKKTKKKAFRLAPINRLALLPFNFPWSFTKVPLTHPTGTLCCGSRNPISWELCFFHWFGLHNPFFTRNINNYFCGHSLFIDSTKLVFIVDCNEFLMVSGWRADTELNLDTTDPLGCATKKTKQKKCIV